MPNPDEPVRWVAVKAAAALADVDSRTVARWIRAGSVRARRLPSAGPCGRWRIAIGADGLPVVQAPNVPDRGSR